MRRWFAACLTPEYQLWLVFIFCLLCTGCEGQKPESTINVAAHGLISGALPTTADYAMVGSVQHGGSLWNLTNNERLYNWNHRAGEYSALRAVGISGDGKVAATAVDADIVVWDVPTGQSLNFWRAPNKIMAMQLGHQGQYAILGLQNSQAVYFDMQKGNAVYEFQHDAEVFGVSLSQDRQLAMTGSDDRTARIWRLSDGVLLHKFEHGNQVKTVALSADGILAFSTAQREDAVIWEVASGAAKTKLNFRYENYTAARFSHDNATLLLGTFRGDVFLVSTGSGKKL